MPFLKRVFNAVAELGLLGPGKTNREEMEIGEGGEAFKAISRGNSSLGLNLSQSDSLIPSGDRMKQVVMLPWHLNGWPSGAMRAMRSPTQQ